MRGGRLLVCFACVAVLLSQAAGQQADERTKSVLETKKGKFWTELVQNQNYWNRVAYPAKSKLAAKNPWKFEDDNILSCAGVGHHEMFLYDNKFKLPVNGVFHVEFRIKKPAAASATVGVVVRTSSDGSLYHEAQFGNKSGGYFIGKTIKDGKNIAIPKNFLAGPQRTTEAGEWNTVEITAKDKTLSLWINGYVTSEFVFCDVAKGSVGLKVDNANAEFKNLQYMRIR
jgi:hypothetical protein